VVVGLYNPSTVTDYALSAAAVPLNPLVGWVKNRGRRAAQPDPCSVRVRPPTMTFPDIVCQARDLLPGVRLRRRLFFRYTLLWRKR